MAKKDKLGNVKRVIGKKEKLKKESFGRRKKRTWINGTLNKRNI